MGFNGPQYLIRLAHQDISNMDRLEVVEETNRRSSQVSVTETTTRGILRLAPAQEPLAAQAPALVIQASSPGPTLFPVETRYSHNHGQRSYTM
ncbi:unnamed protein product [Microthlaspi erraticum]|uniref:Uncharacterized protein n=1 Tax=Microthlaspi erraticum TaxID=1685480 RepID=A0A6D2JZZ5_9BRAS|nr:unnamed protein product [Microthlaspi erraticum]